MMSGPMGPYELVDNVDYGSHDQALSWLAEHYSGSLHVATGYVSLEGLDSLAKLGSEREHPSRLLIGTAPVTLAGSPQETVANRFQLSVSALRRERDFSAFPRRAPGRPRKGDGVLRVGPGGGEEVHTTLSPRQGIRHRPAERLRVARWTGCCAGVVGQSHPGRPRHQP